MKGLKTFLAFFLAVVLLMSFVVLAAGQDKKDIKKTTKTTEQAVSTEKAKSPNAETTKYKKLEKGECPHSKDVKALIKNAVTKTDCETKCKAECEQSAKCQTECQKACEKEATKIEKEKK